MKNQYIEAARAIQAWMIKGEMRPGDPLPSSRSLAAQLGFTANITERACQDLISKRLLTRTGYKLFMGAGTPSHDSSLGTVYVVSYWDGFNRVAGRILAERGVNHRAVELTHEKHLNPIPALRKIFAEKPAGVILWMPIWRDGLASTLTSAKIPMVICTAAAPEDLPLTVVGPDNYGFTAKALRHLQGLGHRRIAYIHTDPISPLNRVFAEHYRNCYRNACLNLGLKESASAIWHVKSPELLRDTLLAECKKHPEVTALFARSHDAAMAKRLFRVPKELSVVGIGASTSMTTAAFPDGDKTMVLWACTNLISQIQTIASGCPAPLPHHALFVPALIDNGSTRALTLKESNIKTPGGKNRPGQIPSASPWESWRRTYSYLKKRGESNWRQLDLTKLANHSMTREHGWLGDAPLLYFSPGLRSIHGVPFQVIDENRNGGHAVVTFLSPRTHSTGKQQLPSTVRLPLGARVKSLYFLHGCGWARLVRFAEYIMHFKDGKASTVPLTSFGFSPQLTRNRAGSPKPNIHDWWPLGEPRDFPHAKHATIFNPADPAEFERYLYTLEWINPRPKEEISHIEVRVDPKAGPTLALIAVTALL